jgi:hypothetical protein
MAAWRRDFVARHSPAGDQCTGSIRRRALLKYNEARKAALTRWDTTRARAERCANCDWPNLAFECDMRSIVKSEQPVDDEQERASETQREKQKG